MALFLVLLVTIAVLQASFTFAGVVKKGYSFETQAGAYNPEPLSYADQLTAGGDGNPYSVLVGTGDAGTASGDANPSALSPATITAPQFIWTDYNGNVYFTDAKNHLVRKIDTSNVVTIYAGNGGAGLAGDGDFASNAQFSRPRGISGGNGFLVVADTGNARVRRIDLATNQVSSIAGTTQGYSGDGALATAAELWSPYGVWVDELRNNDVYFTELHKCTIRVISGATGFIHTIAGVQGTCSFNDNGIPTATFLNLPRAIHGDPAGNIYFTEFGSNIVRKLLANRNQLEFVAGHPNIDPKVTPNAGDGGDAKAAFVNRPTGVWVDRVGNVYIAETLSAVVRRVTVADGKINTVLGVQGTRGPISLATKNILFNPRGVYGDQRTTHKIYLPDTDNHRIVTVDLPTPKVTTFAGNNAVWDGTPYTAGDNKDATDASLNSPADIWKDATGNVYFTDYDGHAVFKVDIAGKIVTFAGTGTSGPAVAGPVAATSATFNNPWGIWGDSDYVYVADSGNGALRRIQLSDNTVTTVAGGGASRSTSEIDATTAQLANPSGVWGDGSGKVYFNDVTDCVLRSLNTATGKLKIELGTLGTCKDNNVETGVTTPSGAFNPGNFYLQNPKGLALNEVGNLLIAEYGFDSAGNPINSQIREFDPVAKKNNQVSVFLGTGVAGNAAEGVIPSSSVQTNLPNSIWMDQFNNIYISEIGSNKIKGIFGGNLFVTVAGSGTPGFGGENVAPTDPSVQFNKPYGIWGDNSNRLYVADKNNRRVRLITYVNGDVGSRRLSAMPEGAVESETKQNLRRA